ncbi:MAG: hypothetical protein ABGY29_05425 [bacterium]
MTGASWAISLVPGCSGSVLALDWALEAMEPGAGTWAVLRKELAAPIAIDPAHVILVQVGAATGEPPAYRVEIKLGDAAECRTTLHVQELSPLPIWRTTPAPAASFAKPAEAAWSTYPSGTELGAVVALEVAISDPTGGERDLPCRRLLGGSPINTDAGDLPDPRSLRHGSVAGT